MKKYTLNAEGNIYITNYGTLMVNSNDVLEQLEKAINPDEPTEMFAGRVTIVIEKFDGDTTIVVEENA